MSAPGARVHLGEEGLSLEWPDRTAWRGVQARLKLKGGTELRSGAWSKSTSNGERHQAECGGLRLELLLDASPEGWTLSLEARPDGPPHPDGSDEVVQVALTGTLTIAGAAPRWLLYSGYQSWDRSGCLALTAADKAAGSPTTESWWTAGVADDDGAGLAAVAAEAREAATRFEVAGAEFSLVWSDGIGVQPLTLFRTQAEGPWRSPAVRLVVGSDVRLCLNSMTQDGLAAPRLRGWVSWYHFGPFVTRADVAEHSRLLAEGAFSELGYRLIQLDDGWQQAYGEWTPNTKFPGGLSSLADEVGRRGQCLGVWTAPFLVSASADLAEQAPADWFVTDPATGQRLVEERHRVFGPMFALDASRPGVQEFLRNLYAGMYAAGVRYFKIDFLYAGGYAGSRALAAGLTAIKEGAQDAYLLASGAPLLAVVGLTHGCRIGPDTATPLMDFEDWTPSPTVFSDEVVDIGRNLAARGFLNGWFQLDADAALVGGNLTLDQARGLVTLAALAGGPFLASDDLGRLPAERLELLTNPEVLALAGSKTALPDWEPNLRDLPPAHWRRGDVLALFNWTAEDVEVPVKAPGARGARDLWARASLPEFRDGTKLQVPANGVRLLRLNSG